MVGRFIGSYFLRVMSPGKILAAVSTGAILLIAISANTTGTLVGLQPAGDRAHELDHVPDDLQPGLREARPARGGRIRASSTSRSSVEPSFRWLTGFLADMTGSLEFALRSRRSATRSSPDSASSPGARRKARSWPALTEITAGVKWSGRQDSNLRPSAPKADALPGCATPRRRACYTAGPAGTTALNSLLTVGCVRRRCRCGVTFTSTSTSPTSFWTLSAVASTSLAIVPPDVLGAIAERPPRHFRPRPVERDRRRIVVLASPGRRQAEEAEPQKECA